MLAIALLAIVAYWILPVLPMELGFKLDKVHGAYLLEVFGSFLYFAYWAAIGGLFGYFASKGNEYFAWLGVFLSVVFASFCCICAIAYALART